MNYELAKELKAAGYSQDKEGSYWIVGEDGEPRRRDGVQPTHRKVAPTCDCCYIPTLEELIEACPKNIGTATFVLGSANQGKEWVACYFDFRTNRGAEFNESGVTLVEAVARLWLALYAKPGDNPTI
jgi:hypothetical protein